MKGKTIIELVASALVLLFLYAAFSQVIFHNTYYTQLSRSTGNGLLAGIITWLIPVVHLSLAWLLWKRKRRLAGLICSLGAVGLYTIYLFIMLPLGSKASCQCGELWQRASLEINILFNLAVILPTAVAIILMGRLKTNSPRLT